MLVKDSHKEEINVMLVKSGYGLTQFQDKFWLNFDHLMVS